MKKKIIVLYTTFKSGNLKSLKYLVSYHLSVLHQRALSRAPRFLVGRKVLVWVTEMEFSIRWFRGRQWIRFLTNTGTALPTLIVDCGLVVNATHDHESHRIHEAFLSTFFISIPFQANRSHLRPPNANKPSTRIKRPKRPYPRPRSSFPVD